MQAVTSDIIEITSGQPGPTLAIFAGVHGNETAGVFALQEMLPGIMITKGNVYVAFANPPAIRAGVRMLNKNLNRCFFSGNKGTSYEDTRARELMAVLDKSDALLDLHMFNDPTGVPFAICEEPSMAFAQKLDVSIISTNWTQTEPGGTDGYMHLTGKVGVCVECGPIDKAQEYTDFARNAILQFLQFYNMSTVHVAYSTRPKRLIKASHAVLKESETFKLLPNFRNFDRLAEGQVIANDGDTQYTARAGECIIFPYYTASLHAEAYIIGNEL